MSDKSFFRLSRPRIILFAVVVLSLVLCAAILASCNKPAELIPSDTETVYDMRLDYHGGDKATLSADILYFNTTGKNLSELKFHLYPNAFSEGNSTPPYREQDKETFFYDGVSFGGIDILSAKIDRATVEYELCGNGGQILSVPCNIEKDESVTVSLECELTIPKCRSRYGITPDSVNLTGFYPSLCVYENGAWREDEYTPSGDPFYSETASFYLRISLPENYLAATSGEVTERTVSDGTAVLDVTAEHVRDFALCLSDKFSLSETDFTLDGNEVRVNYFYLNDAKPEETLALAMDAVETFSDAFGNYPYPALTVVQSPLNAGGMEYGSLVIIDSSIADESVYRDTVVHEIAHQWWFGVVGSDQINSPWLDEGLTEFSTAYYHLLKGEESLYAQTVRQSKEFYLRYENLPQEIGFDGSMDRPLGSYLTDGEYVAVTYMKGLLLFDSLLQVAGKDKFNAALSEYYRSCAYKIATPDDLIAAFSSQGLPVGGIVNGFVDGKVLLG